MPTITFTIDGPPGNAGELRFVPRGPFTTPDGKVVSPASSMRRVAYQVGTPATVDLPQGPWTVAGLTGGNPLPIDVGTSNALLKDLIVFSLPNNAPATTLAEAVSAWMAVNVNTEVTDTLMSELLADEGSDAVAAVDARVAAGTAGLLSEEVAENTYAPTSAVAAKYTKPGDGIPTADLAPAVTDQIMGAVVVAKPSMFVGIDPTGVTDSAAGIQAAVNATPPGGTLIIPGTIRLSTAVAVTDRSITIQVEGTINSDTGVAPFSVTATPETVYAVTSVSAVSVANGTGVTQPGLSVVLTSGTPAWARGDVVKLLSDDEVPGARLGDGTSEARFGQYHAVESVSGSTVTLVGSLRDACTTGIRITRIPKHSVTLTGAGVFGNIGKPITFRHLLAPRINVHILKSGGQGVLLSGCYQAVADITVDDAPDDGTVYGYGLLDNSGAGGEYRVCAARVRHAYTDDTPRVAVGSTEVWKHGRSFGHHVSGVATATSNTAWDTHAAAENVRFDTLAVDCVGGLGLRGRRHSGRVRVYRPAKASWKFFSEPNRGTDSWGHDIEVDVFDPPGGVAVGSAILNDGTGFAWAGTRETRPSRVRVRIHADGAPATALEAVNATVLHEVTLLTKSGRIAPGVTLTNSTLRTEAPLTFTPTVLTSDGFSGTNGNIATGRNTDNEFGGATLSWTASPSSRLGIQSGMLVSGSVDGLGGIYLPVTEANVRATLRVRDINSDSEILHLDIRRQTNSHVIDGTDNAWTAIIGAGKVQLAKKVAGVLTRIGDVFSYPAESDVAIQGYGSLITILVNGEEKISVTDTAVPSGSYVGIYKTKAGNIRNPNWMRVDTLAAA
ncbi:hypothetical protein [Gordonia alkanivorans]|uniref:hypothetical protein n=1 Tax=Gordonia alkanivorans TaxID=84096 RepID=UPI0024B807A4|nr:hypothetical protein [Gordonia alkanivorans]MDJ0010083.1 hypothetical protein [Gordonia alkanivorans]MDJ0495727.1 hypothetical protein [Gordonia alkanivorans]